MEIGLDKTIQSLIVGTYDILHKYSEDDYATMKNEIAPIAPNYTTEYALNFPIRPFNNKLKYFKRLIDNEIARIVNLVLYIVGEDSGTAIYVNMKIEKLLNRALKNTQEQIDRGNYYLFDSIGENVRYYSNLTHYERVYIYNYIQQSVMLLALEAQAKIIQYLPQKEPFSIERFYTELLQVSIPNQLYISKIQRIETQNSNALNVIEDIPKDYETEPTRLKVFIDAVKGFGFFNLPKIQQLSNKLNQNKLIDKMLQEGVAYSVAMLCFLEYDHHLRREYKYNKEQLFAHWQNALSCKSKRLIKGNYNIINVKNSTEDSERYLAYKYTDEVKNDYEIYCQKTS